MENRSILCIDLKSFFASVECVERKLDAFSTPLVVCDPQRNGAITLAVSPYLKTFGVPGRCRVYELDKYLPKEIQVIKAPPRMRLYQQKSKEVIGIYLDYIAEEDLHVYSIDEAFLDVTDYLTLYQKDAYALAKEILNRVYEKTGLTATAGIGPNLLLAKVSMDIEAKHIKDNIAFWTMKDVKEKLWKITPLSKMWGIGSRMEIRLNKMGMYSIGDIANSDVWLLKKTFGVIGEELWLHANGIDETRIKELKTKEVKEKSFSHSQVLFKDYYAYNIDLIVFEMIDVLCRRLRTEKYQCRILHFGISYSKNIGGGFHHSIKLDTNTDEEQILYRECMAIFEKFYIPHFPIRKVSIHLSGLVENNHRQLNLFEEFEEMQKNIQIKDTIDDIKSRFGANTIVRASSLLEDSTAIARNNMIGGHHA